MLLVKKYLIALYRIRHILYINHVLMIFLDPKGGSCPSIGLKRCIGPSSECSLDSQCTGKRKCCSIDNLKCCVDPENAN